MRSEKCTIFRTDPFRPLSFPFLHRRRFPKQKRINVEGDVDIKQWNGEVGLLLGEGQGVIIVQPRSD